MLYVSSFYDLFLRLDFFSCFLNECVSITFKSFAEVCPTHLILNHTRSSKRKIIGTPKQFQDHQYFPWSPKLLFSQDLLKASLYLNLFFLTIFIAYTFRRKTSHISLIRFSLFCSLSSHIYIRITLKSLPGSYPTHLILNHARSTKRKIIESTKQFLYLQHFFFGHHNYYSTIYSISKFIFLFIWHLLLGIELLTYHQFVSLYFDHSGHFL